MSPSRMTSSGDRSGPELEGSLSGRRGSWLSVRVAGITVCGALLAGLVLAGEKAPEQKASGLKFASATESRTEYDRVVAPFFARHCVSCHGPKQPKGDLALGKLNSDMKASTSAARWAMLLEKLATREMPPESRPRPDEQDVQAVVRWILAEMKRAGKHIAHRREYANGNKLAHQLLFDPRQSAPFDAPARVRRLSPEIYAAFLRDQAKGIQGVGNPFSPEGRYTFKDMGAPKIDEPVTSQLLRNALQIVARQTAFKVEGGKLKGIGSVRKEFLTLLDEKQPLTDAAIEAAIKEQFGRVLGRTPTAEEQARFVKLMHKNAKDAGRVTGVRYTLAAVFLLPEAVFRWEVGAGKADAQGRVRLAPREIASALAFALTDRRPDGRLLAEADQGKLNTREGVAAAVQRMLDDSRLETPRILRFFREYFGYEAATEVFKNNKDNPEHDARALVEDTDRLVEYILEQDKNVLRELLTTNKSFVAWRTAADIKKKRAKELAKFEEKRKQDPKKFKNKKRPKVGRNIYEAYNLSDFPDRQPVELPANERAGILTQPAWLVAFSTSDDNHAIHRGKWVRERLLGGVVPNIPITVDAQLPQTPEKTLRQRMDVTRQEYCWKCHQLMNPVGLPFEMYDHFGRYRTEEEVLDPEATAKNVDKKGRPQGPVTRGVPVDASGSIGLTGDPRLEGDVKNALDLVRKLASSERVEQIFVRHAFRYWMGRNETLGDAPSLQAAHRAYRESGGSMKALIVALLSSDSFLYRVPTARK
jgi:mono/diheme cytochrome c family protein